MLMSFVLTLLLVLAGSAFESTIDKAFTNIEKNDWLNAGSALDDAYNSDPAAFEANNFHYLRGRVAESQNDWQRATRRVQEDRPGEPAACPGLLACCPGIDPAARRSCGRVFSVVPSSRISTGTESSTRA